MISFADGRTFGGLCYHATCKEPKRGLESLKSSGLQGRSRAARGEQKSELLSSS